MFRRFFDLFLFSSCYIALCAVLMVHQTNDLLDLKYQKTPYFLFVFFATICSYNFHWYLTPFSETEVIRKQWTQKHKALHIVLFSIGLLGSTWYFFYFVRHWFWMGGAVALTFLYSAPKLPIRTFWVLRKIAIGKTIFLAFVWMYVTTLLPIVFSEKGWGPAEILFCMSRFLLVYSICIIFDYRDRLQDRLEGIRSMITYFNERGINILFLISLSLFAVSTAALYYAGFRPGTIMFLLVPGIILLALYNTARRNFSDYLYYFILDGLMMLSAIFTSFISF